MSEQDELEAVIDTALYTDSFYGDMFRDGHNRKTLIDVILAAGLPEALRPAHPRQQNEGRNKMSTLLENYSYETSSYRRIPGTDDWVEVATLGDQGGYDWTDFNAFYSPSARRYFWHGESGCSCNSWGDDLSSASDFQNGERDALLRSWETFAKVNEYSISVTEYQHGVGEIRNFKPSAL